MTARPASGIVIVEVVRSFKFKMISKIETRTRSNNINGVDGGGE